MNRFETDLTKGNVARQLLRFSLPFLISNLIQAMYSVADLYIVSLCCPTGSVVGVNVGGQVAMLVTNLAVGLALGGTIVLAQYAGAKREKDMRETISTLMAILCGIAVVLTIVMLVFSRPILQLLNTPETSMLEAQRYLNICMLGNIFVFGYNAISAMLRALGDSKRPLVLVAIACLVNIGLDALLVIVFHMGAAGAALATIASQGMAMLMAIVYLNRANFMFSFKLSNLRVYKDKLRKIISMGLPASVQSVFVSISFLVLTAMTNTFGEEAAAGAAAIGKINTFCILPGLAIAQSVSPMAAQNVGAGRYDRALKALWSGIGMTACVGVVMFFVMQLFSPQLTGLFANDPATRDEVIAYGTQYARAMSFDYLLIPFVFNMNNFVNGTGHAKPSLIANILSSILLRIPVSYLLGMVMGLGLTGLGYGIPASTAGTIVYIGLFVASGRWKHSPLGIAAETGGNSAE